MHSYQLNNQDKSMLENLAPDELVSIFSHLNFKELASVMLVNKTIYSNGKLTLKANGFWESNIIKLFINYNAAHTLRKIVLNKTSVDDLSQETQAKLPEEISPVVDLLKQYFKKSEKYQFQVQQEQHQESADDSPSEEEAKYSPRI